MPIPKILHQTWKTTNLPPLFERCRKSWLSLHPGWEHRFYDDVECHAFVRGLGEPWLPIYERLTTGIQRADLFRYLVVQSRGGVYADMDMECHRPIDALLEGASCLLSIEAHVTRRRQRELGYLQPLQLANCIFAAAPHAPFLTALLERVASAVRGGTAAVRRDEDVEDTTGPRMLTRCYESLSSVEQSAIRVLPQILLMAPRELPRVPILGPPVHAVHLCAGTWKSERRAFSLQRWFIERNRLPPLWPRLQF